MSASLLQGDKHSRGTQYQLDPIVYHLAHFTYVNDLSDVCCYLSL